MMMTTMMNTTSIPALILKIKAMILKTTTTFKILLIIDVEELSDYMIQELEELEFLCTVENVNNLAVNAFRRQSFNCIIVNTTFLKNDQNRVLKAYANLDDRHRKNMPMFLIKDLPEDSLKVLSVRYRDQITGTLNRPFILLDFLKQYISYVRKRDKKLKN